LIPLAIPPFSPNLAQDVADMLSYDFMRYAFIAGGCIALAAGLVGYFVVLRNQVFTSDALGHVAFTGGLGGLIVGLPLLPSVFASTMVAAVGIGSLGGRERGRDVAIGTVFAWVLGLGVFFLSIYTTLRSGATGIVGVTVLFGSILTLQASQAAIAAGAGLATSIALLAICRPLLFAAVDPEVAVTRGVPVRLVTLIFLVLVGATVAEAVQAVGALLIFGLLVTPAAIAQNVTARPYAGMLLAAGLSIAFVWVGLALGFYISYPVSFFVVGLSSVSYVLSSLVREGRPAK
jgi:zinc/manganese transport system permease protein